MRSKRVFASVAIAAIAGAGTTAGIAWGSIPDANGVISGCITKKSVLLSPQAGTVRIIDSATQHCASNESPITWNQQGPTGPQGPPGDPGPSTISGFSTTMRSGDSEQLLMAVGPLRLVGSCRKDGATTDARIVATTSLDEMIINGVDVTPDGPSVIADEADSTLDSTTADLAALDPAGTAALDGAVSAVVNTPGAECRFLGHVNDDS